MATGAAAHYCKARAMGQERDRKRLTNGIPPTPKLARGPGFLLILLMHLDLSLQVP